MEYESSHLRESGKRYAVDKLSGLYMHKLSRYVDLFREDCEVEQEKTVFGIGPVIGKLGLRDFFI